jgi:hypothetical protein
LQIYPLWPDIVIQLGNRFAAVVLLRLKNHPSRKPEEPVSIFTGKPGGIKLSDFGKKDFIQRQLASERAFMAGGT